LKTADNPAAPITDPFGDILNGSYVLKHCSIVPADNFALSTPIAAF
jgi:hypothetical protein